MEYLKQIRHLNMLKQFYLFSIWDYIQVRAPKYFEELYDILLKYEGRHGSYRGEERVTQGRDGLTAISYTK